MIIHVFADVWKKKTTVQDWIFFINLMIFMASQSIVFKSGYICLSHKCFIAISFNSGYKSSTLTNHCPSTICIEIPTLLKIPNLRFVKVINLLINILLLLCALLNKERTIYALKFRAYLCIPAYGWIDTYINHSLSDR